MRTSLRAAAVTAGVVLSLGLASPAFAAPGAHGNGVGGCVDNLYGNATNPRPSGHGTLPSLSPGPATMAGGFLSVGEVMQVARTQYDTTGVAVVQAMCSFP
jgi:hypothetical protein